MEITLIIEGMMCEHCTARVKKALEAVDGVTDAKLSLNPGSAVITGEGLDREALVNAVLDQGFDVVD